MLSFIALPLPFHNHGYRVRVSNRVSCCNSAGASANTNPNSNTNEPLRLPAASDGTSGKNNPVNFGFVAANKIGVAFTCNYNNCGTRISKMIRRTSYEKGTCLIMCPSCGVKHIISDHYGWYSDVSQNLQNIERIANAKGQKVKRVSSQVFHLEKLFSEKQQNNENKND